MRFIATISLILCCTYLNGQVVREAVIAEYKSGFIDTSGRFWAGYYSAGLRATQLGGSMRFTQADGGQYNMILLRDNGDVYEQSNGTTTLTYLQLDTTGANFKASYVECYFQCYIAVGLDGKIYSMKYNHYNWFAGGTSKILNKWTQIPNQPAGVTFVKTRNGGPQGSGYLLALTNTGAVYILADNSTTWVLKSLPAGVDDIYASYNGFYIAMIDSLPYGWGQRKYLTGGTAGNISTYEPLADDWSLGAHKIIDLAVNDNTIHYITDDNKLWGFGDNAMGEVGVGWELVNRKELYKGDWMIWNWLTPTQASYQTVGFIGTPQWIRQDKLFKRVWASDYFAFYCFAQELSTNNMFFWGRNKSAVGYQGIGTSSEATIPNCMDVVAPTLANIFTNVTQSSTEFIFGTINAGSNQAISATSTTLSGSATAGHTNNWSYSIASYEWTKLSGNSCTIVSPSSASTSVTGLTNGTYTFQLKVTDNNTATITDTVTVTVAALPPAIAASASYAGGGVANLSSTVTSPDGIKWVQWSVLKRPGQPLFKIFIGGSSTPAGSTGVTSVDSAWPFIYKRFLVQNGLLDTMYWRPLGGTSTRNGLPTSTGGYGVSGFDTTRNITYATKRQVHLAIMGYASNDMTAWQPADHLAWFREIRDSAQAAGVVYYVTTTQPRPAYSTTDEQKLRTIRDSQLVQLNAIEAYKGLVTPGTMNFKPELDYGDGIHTNNAGHRIVLAPSVIGTNPLKSLTKGSAVFANENAQNTTVSGLTAGTWTLMASIQDTNGITAYQLVTLEVPAAPTNEPPTVDAGADQRALQTDTITLTAAAEDVDGTIQSYQWEKISGPDDAFIAEASSPTTQVSFVNPGVYHFRVTVFDDAGASAFDDVIITVKPVFKIKRFGRFNFSRPD